MTGIVEEVEEEEKEKEEEVEEEVCPPMFEHANRELYCILFLSQRESFNSKRVDNRNRCTLNNLVRVHTFTLVFGCTVIPTSELKVSVFVLV